MSLVFKITVKGSRKSAEVRVEQEVLGQPLCCVTLKRGNKPYHVKHGMLPEEAKRWARIHVLA